MGVVECKCIVHEGRVGGMEGWGRRVYLLDIPQPACFLDILARSPGRYSPTVDTNVYVHTYTTSFTQIPTYPYTSNSIHQTYIAKHTNHIHILYRIIHNLPRT
ncbi:hypothetical protein EON63_16685 [archaeon]|nr:MAG: hypothetical protein EON63_16685 [archaeon]